jgi:type III restriction enzyme
VCDVAELKLNFDPNLDFQQDAIAAVADLFRGQEECRTEFTVVKGGSAGQQLGIGQSEDTLGYGNRLRITPERISNNLEEIQIRNGLPSEPLSDYGMNFTVEMETGTGKTYVYLRTICELNRRYGFTKFVVVVPSVAIREGTLATISSDSMKDHLRELYAGVTINEFVYDSARLGDVTNFASSADIQIMITTAAGINKASNIMNRSMEETGGRKPIELIQDTNPVVIVDEPQSVEGGKDGAGRKAIEEMKPLCTLRYSATHKDPFHMVYRLDAVDAYEKRLVKQIEVASATTTDDDNLPYIKVDSVKSSGKKITARVEISKAVGDSVTRKKITVTERTDLEPETGRSIYENVRIGEIKTDNSGGLVEVRLPGAESEWLTPGQAIGDVDQDALAQALIERTVAEHFERELRLREDGIKVLSLFFIDEVAKYRAYDEKSGQPSAGIYAQIFEKAFKREAQKPAYKEFFEGKDLDEEAKKAHNGYFAVDRKTVAGEKVELFKDSKGKAETKADSEAYELIMREKEKLLSFDEPLRFIFSHSALREGWDNPNVFQICALRNIKTEGERRQTIGRGMRLCVNQDGERQQGFDPNTLTVVATEGYKEFAAGLQKEIEKDTGIKFGHLDGHEFASIPVENPDGSERPLRREESEKLVALLKEQGLITDKGKVTEDLKAKVDVGEIELPEALAPYSEEILLRLKKLCTGVEVKNSDERRTVPRRQAVLESKEFQELWDRVKAKTTYRVEFDPNELIETCVKQIREADWSLHRLVIWEEGVVEITDGGVVIGSTAESTRVLEEGAEVDLPDLMTDLEARTHLKRRTLAEIITKSGRIEDFKKNPQKFIELTANLINRAKRDLLVDGVKYERVGDEVFGQELFVENELTGYLTNMLENAEKSPYESVVYDSEVERKFAEDLESDPNVKVYAKLPGWFTIPTPLGDYNPDWAVLIEEGQSRKLYFVVETKGTTELEDLRPSEKQKISCGKQHFAALRESGEGARYRYVKDMAGLVQAAHEVANEA